MFFFLRKFIFSFENMVRLIEVFHSTHPPGKRLHQNHTHGEYWGGRVNLEWWIKGTEGRGEVAWRIRACFDDLKRRAKRGALHLLLYSIMCVYLAPRIQGVINRYVLPLHTKQMLSLCLNRLSVYRVLCIVMFYPSPKGKGCSISLCITRRSGFRVCCIV